MNAATKAVATWIISRMKEPSTWRGLAMLATMAGVPAGTIEPTLQIGLTLIGILGLTPDAK